MAIVCEGKIYFTSVVNETGIALGWLLPWHFLCFLSPRKLRPPQLSLDIFDNVCLTCWIQVQNPHTSSYHLDFMRSIFLIKLKLKPWPLGCKLCSLEWEQSWFFQATQHNLASLGSTGKCDFPHACWFLSQNIWRINLPLISHKQSKLCTHSWKLKKVGCPTCASNKKVPRLEFK